MANKKIQDYRALYGALSLVLIGLVLSFQFIFYLRDDDLSKEIVRARWHWEIVLNIQILCFAFMWFSHHNRILFSRGRWRVRAIVNFILGFVMVGAPTVIMLVAAILDWYHFPPDPGLPKFLLTIVISAWLTVVLGAALIKTFFPPRRKNHDRSKGSAASTATGGFLYRYWPGMLAAIMVAGNEMTAGDVGLVLAVFLCFLQGASTYYIKAKKPPFYKIEAQDAG